MKKIIFITLIIAIFLALGACSIKKASQQRLAHPEEEFTQNTQKQTDQEKTQEKQKEIAISTEIYTPDDLPKKTYIDIKYPKISLDNQEIQEKINQTILNKVESSYHNLKDAIELDDTSNLPPELENSLYINFTQYNQAYSILPITLSFSEYLAGAAHPNNHVEAFNFNLKTGEPVELNQIFTTTDYLTTLSEKIVPYINQKYTEMELEENTWDKTGVEPTEVNYQDFVIKNDSLTVIFNPYQIGPYALGVIEIDLPWNEIENILNKQIITN